MELLLNLVWLLIALVALTRVVVWARGERDRRRVVLVGLATVCALALLFPIISVTDDLQMTVATVEETVSVRRLVAAAAFHVHSLLAASLASVCSLITALAVLGFTIEYMFVLPNAPSRSVLLLRGPPSLV